MSRTGARPKFQPGGEDKAPNAFSSSYGRSLAPSSILRASCEVHCHAPKREKKSCLFRAKKKWGKDVDALRMPNLNASYPSVVGVERNKNEVFKAFIEGLIQVIWRDWCTRGEISATDSPNLLNEINQWHGLHSTLLPTNTCQF